MATPSGNYQFGFNGWLFGGVGQGVQILEIDGLEDIPELRVQDDSAGYRDGMVTGRDFLGGRTVTFKLQIMSDVNAPMQTYLQQLKQYLVEQQSGTSVLQFQLPNYNLRRLNGRIRKRVIKVDPLYTYGQAFADVELFCPDPRIYDDALFSTTFNPSAALGRVYPRVYPMVYNTSTGSIGNIQTLTNNGNVTTYPTLTVTGPCSNPYIYNQSTGQYLSFSVTLGANDVLYADTDSKAITLSVSGGTPAPARNLLVNGSSWFGISPGSTTISFTTGAYTSGSLLTMNYRSAYI